MINNYIKEQLDKNNVNSIDSLKNIIREEAQKIILYSLSKTNFFNHAAFYGGTCLRLFHNLDRFSENLDFAVTENNSKIDLNNYVSICVKHLESYGFQTTVATKDSYDSGEIRRRYFKIPIYDITKEYLNVETNKEMLVTIKIEVSTIYIPNAKMENKLLVSPLFASIKCYDYPTLFSGKLNALLSRSWKQREKGRDYYDYMFYLSHSVKFNMEYLKSKLKVSLGSDYEHIKINDVREMVRKKIEETDFSSVRKDLEPFIFNREAFESISKELFIESVDFLDCE